MVWNQEGNHQGGAEGSAGRRTQPWEAALGGSLEKGGDQATKNAEITPIQANAQPTLHSAVSCGTHLQAVADICKELACHKMRCRNRFGKDVNHRH